MIIRKAISKDALGIAEVHVQSWKEAYKGIISQDFLDGLRIEDRLPLWESNLNNPNPNAPVYVAEDSNGKIVGFSSFGKERTKNNQLDGELYAIYLLSEVKRKKVGSKLLLAGINDMLSQGFESLLVWVLADNPGRRFYEQYGSVKETSELIQIADVNYEEIAYKWSDLKELMKEVEQKTKKN